MLPLYNLIIFIISSFENYYFSGLSLSLNSFSFSKFITICLLILDPFLKNWCFWCYFYEYAIVCSYCSFYLCYGEEILSFLSNINAVDCLKLFWYAIFWIPELRLTSKLLLLGNWAKLLPFYCYRFTEQKFSAIFERTVARNSSCYLRLIEFWDRICLIRTTDCDELILLGGNNLLCTICSGYLIGLESSNILRFPKYFFCLGNYSENFLGFGWCINLWFEFYL